MQWDDPSAYKYTKSLNLREWGWEFIRRDKRYKAEWEEHYKSFEKAGGQKNLMFLLLNGDELSQFSRQNILSPNDYMNLGNPEEIDTFIILSNDALKWGLRGYKNPKARKLHDNQTLIVPVFYVDKDTPSTELNAISDKLITALDLTKPIARQIEVIKKLAIELQDSLRKEGQNTIPQRAKDITHQNQKLWTQYIRLLDSKNLGVKRKEAAGKLYGGAAQTPEAKYSQHLQQIKELEKSRYMSFMR